MTLKPGDLVQGKTKFIANKTGRIISAVGEGRKRKLSVEWNDKTLGEYLVTTLKKFAGPQREVVNQNPIAVPPPQVETHVDPSSDGIDDGESDGDDKNDSEDEGDVENGIGREDDEEPLFPREMAIVNDMDVDDNGAENQNIDVIIGDQEPPLPPPPPSVEDEAVHHHDEQQQEEVDNNIQEEEEPLPPPPDPLLHPHGTAWVEVDGVPEQNVPDQLPTESRLNWRGHNAHIDGMKPHVQYFYHMFPMLELESMVQGTNIGLAEKNLRLTSQAEVLRWMGIRLAATIEKRRGDVATWFKGGDEEGSIRSWGNYTARFHMSESRFNVMTKALRLRVLPANDEERRDDWFMIRKFVEQFNSLRKRNVTPGQYLTVDECMSAWVALGGEFKVDGIPHVTKIARKPEGVGCEMKALCDPCSGIMLHLEIMEGKDAMRQKEMYREYGAGASCVYRMTRFYHGSGRTIIGDSWFGSVSGLKLFRTVGLYGMFLVKTATKHYPMRFLKEWSEQQELMNDADGNRIPWGNWKVLKHTVVNNDREDVYYALCHRDRKPKFLICNKGTTLEGAPHQVERCAIRIDDEGHPYDHWFIRETPRCSMIEKYFKNFSCIDVHDHRRQGVLQVEKYWKTKSWWHRLFGTVGLGMCLVDAYLAYRMDWLALHDNDDHDIEDFITFASKVTYELINNEYFDAPAAAPRRRANRHLNNNVHPAPPERRGHEHILQPLSSHERFANRNRGVNTRSKLHCKMCGKQTGYYCVQCSENDRLFACCNPWSQAANGAPRRCYFDHT